MAAPRHQTKGTFRAPARGTFALGGKSTQKRRSNLRFENPLRGFTRRLSCPSLPRERCTSEISPKCCIVSASLFAVAFALKCRAVQPCYLWQDCFYKSRPSAATYLCRFAAKARFDNRPSLRRVFPKREGRSPPSLVVQGWGIFKGEGRSKRPSPLNGAFGYFCRYCKSNPSETPRTRRRGTPFFRQKRKHPVGGKRKTPPPPDTKKAARRRPSYHSSIYSSVSIRP